MASRVKDPADPDRCKGTFPHEQCWNRRQDGSDYCVHHCAGNLTADSEALRLYHLTEARHRQRLSQLREHNQVQTLRESIALARMLVEKCFNSARTDAEFLSACGPLNTLELTVERLVKSAHSIEKSLDVLLSKHQVFQLGQLILTITREELETLPSRDSILDRVTERIVGVISSASNTPVSLAEKLPAMVRQRLPSDAVHRTFRLDDQKDLQRLVELTSNENLKSLNEDISLQSLMIERRWNLIKTDFDLVQAVPVLNQLLRTLEKQIKSAHDIEQSLGRLLSGEAVQRIGAQISHILVEELKQIDDYESYIDQIMDRITSTMAQPARTALPAPKTPLPG